MPAAAPQPRSRTWLPIAIVSGVVVVAILVWVIVSGTSSGASAGEYGLSQEHIDKAPDVSTLAAEAASAAEEVDIDKGIALLCSAPSSEQVETLKEGIDEANEKAGGTAQKRLVISEVSQSGDSGEFVVEVIGEGKLSPYRFTVTVDAAKDGDRWCIQDIKPSDRNW